MHAKDSTSLPTELWRKIIRYSTEESGCPFFPEDSVSFGWPYNPNFNTSFFGSLATKRSLALVSRRFSEISTEFLYETLHFRRAKHAICLVKQCEASVECTGYLRSWTKTLYITPVFDPVTIEEEVEEVDDFLRSVFSIAQICKQLRNVLVQADTVTLFQEPTYQPWVAILSALPSELHHLAVENFLLGPVVWAPRLFSSWDTSLALRTLRLHAAHMPFEHHFPRLTHLWLFSWPTASKWDMPSLTNLYIEYFPGNESTSRFWTETKPLLKLLHFGGDTDFGLYFPDLPQRLESCAPNLQELEYHCSGDLDITWDPSRMPSSLERVTIKLQDGERRGIDSGLTSQDTLLHYTSAGFGVLLKLLTELCPSASHRWVRIERHLEKYSSHNARLFVLLPKHATSSIQSDAPPPLVYSSRVPITLP